MRVVNMHRGAKLVFSTVDRNFNRNRIDEDAIERAKAEMESKGIASAPFADLSFTVRRTTPTDHS